MHAVGYPPIPSLLALLLAAAAAGTARADGPQPSIEAGVLLGPSLVTLEVERGYQTAGLIDGDSTGVLGGAVEWAPIEALRLGGELWLTRLTVPTNDRVVVNTENYIGLAPRMRWMLPITADWHVDMQGSVGTGLLTGILPGGGLAFAWRIGLGVAHRVGQTFELTATASHYSASLWPNKALWPDSRLHVFEPLLVGLDATMLTIGVRAFE